MANINANAYKQPFPHTKPHKIPSEKKTWMKANLNSKITMHKQDNKRSRQT